MVGSGFLLGTEKEASWDVLVENNFFDFPMESLEGDGLDGGDWDVKLQGLGPIPSEALLGSFLTSSGNIGNATCTVPCLSVHSDESPELKPLPKFVEEVSRTSAPLRNGYSNGLESGVLQAPSPVSVLESSSSCSCISMSSEILVPVRTRTKRSQSSTISPWLVTPSIFSTPKTSLHLAASEALSQSYISSEFDLPNTSAEPGKRKPKKKKKLSELSGTPETMQNSRQPPVATKQCSHCKLTKTRQWRAGPMGPKSLCNACGARYRFRHLSLEYRPLSEPLDVPEMMQNSSGEQRVATKQCSHCKVTKTPQWREGPMGRKTLCNACGVRYRSGRLLPEYRPAASPTFVPSLHSNSHRKVVELRCKAIEETAMAESEPPMSPQKVTFPEAAKNEIEPPMSPPPEFIPMSGYLYDCILGSSGQYS